MDKKVPLRKCIGCMEMKPKVELIRIVRDKDGVISIDRTGKANGRGAYVCSDECIKKVLKKKALGRVFGAEVSDEIYNELESSMSNE